MRLRMMLLLQVAIGTLCAHVVGAAMLCARQRADGSFNSTVKIREACKTSETQLGAPFANGQGFGAAGHEPVLVDANGVTIGGWPLYAAVPPLAKPVSVPVVTPNGFVETGFNVYFESTNCTGPALTYVETLPSEFVFKFVGMIGSTAYYAEGPKSPRTVRSSGSRPYPPSWCTDPEDLFIPPDLCCDPVDTFYEEPLAPLGSVDLGPLTPPFHLEVR